MIAANGITPRTNLPSADSFAWDKSSTGGRVRTRPRQNRMLLTQESSDIPFYLKRRQHTVYGGKIAVLRSELAKRLKWAVLESERRAVLRFPMRRSKPSAI